MEINREKVINVMARTWNISPEEIPENVEFNRFPHWDSMGHVNLLLALERELDIEINDETVGQLITLPAIIEYKKGC